MSYANDWNQDPQPSASPNPYAAPASVFEDDFGGQYQPWAGRTLATRGQRLAGTMIDGLVYVVAMIPLFFVMILEESAGANSTLVLVGSGVFGILMLAIFAYNLMRLYSHQQTIGKQVVGTQIIRADLQTPVTLARIFFLRMVPISLLGAIPFIGALINIGNPLMIFQESQQCGHDMIADTNVVLYEEPV